MAHSLKWYVMTLLLLSSMTAMAGGSLQMTQAGHDTPLDQAVVEIMLPGQGALNTPQDHYEIVQRNAHFEPLVTVIPVGASVSFPNQDTTRHQVFSFSPPKVFSLDLYLKETPAPVAFETPGVEVLGCNIHDSMEAFIVISEAPFFAMTDKSGRISLDQLPPGRYPMRVWHPRLEDTHQQWWEGEVDTRIENRVALTLAATPAPSSEPSLLQQRFQRGLQHQEHP
ncbi:Cupredoxin [Kushneria sp. Sum13]|uniref:Cupredoxin n=1 Tax=Kushneria sp. Sum13 TaxID=3459196 RepID=UPI00404582BA